MKARFAACLALLIACAAAAAPDATEGGKLVDAKKCEICHQDKVRGPPGTIYTREGRRVQSWQKLKSQVALCNAAMDMGLFPEEEEHIAAFLNARWYKFPAK